MTPPTTPDPARPPGGPLSAPAANHTDVVTSVSPSWPAFALNVLRASAERRRRAAWRDVDQWAALGYERSFMHDVDTLRAACWELVVAVLGRRR